MIVRTVSAMLIALLALVPALSRPALCLAGEQRQPAAMVVALRGTVTATDTSGASRKLAIKAPIYPDDVIETGPGGRLQIMFTDNGIISLGSRTVFKVAEYQWNGERQEGGIKTEVKEGVFRVMGGMITKTNAESFTMETPVATIGIRGSMYAGQVSPAGLAVLLEGGTGITLTNDTGTVAITTPGFGSRVAGRFESIPPPQPFSSREIMELHGTLASRRSTGSDRPAAGRGRAAPLPLLFDSGRLGAPAGDGGPPNHPGKAGKTGEAERLGELTATVRDRPQEAAAVLRSALDQGLQVDAALEAVLRGMPNAAREHIDAVLKEAIEQGITAEGARKIVKNLREQGACP